MVAVKATGPAVRLFFYAAAAVVGVALVALAASAEAADLPPARGPFFKAAPPPPVYSWAGIYIGANGGGAFGRNCWTFQGTVPSIGLPAPGDDGCHGPSGGVLGGQIGFNWQSGPLVLGAEAQGDWANLRAQNVSLLPSPPFPPSINRSRVDGFGLFTARAGYAFGPALLYLKGGAAAVLDRYDFILTGLGIPPPTASETRWGGTIGGGIEYGITPSLSAAIEYDYLALGTRRDTFTLPGILPNSLVDIRQDMHMLTARLNYRFSQ
jgi:outer membrane immunogenic protein